MTSPIMSEPARPTAAILAFPTRSKPVVPQANERLTRALESLNTAMMEQRAALAAWRGALTELHATTSSLSESLQRYRTNLRSLGNSVSALEAKVRSLKQWVDGVAAED